MLHEIGHLLGLLDLDDNPCPNECGGDAVMSGELPDDAGDCFSEGLTSCDICYFENLYCEFVPEGVGQSNEQNAPPFYLGNCVPSPFINYADVDYSITTSAIVSANLYDILGGLVERVFNGVRPPGSYSLRIDGSSLPSGVYYLRVSAGNQVKTVQVVKSN